MLKALSVISLALLLGACAGDGPPRPDTTSQVNAAGGDISGPADARTRATLHTDLGVGYFSRGQLKIALDELNTAIKIDPTYEPAYNAMGLVYMNLGEDSNASWYFEKGLRLVPDDSETNNNYGWFLCQKGKYQEAIEHFNVALRNPLYPHPETAYANIGICSARKGDLVMATDYLERSMQVRPEFPIALLNLADIAYREGRYNDARAYLGRLQLQGPLDAQALWLGVRVERMRRDRSSMDSYAMQLSNRFPNSKEAELLRNGQF